MTAGSRALPVVYDTTQQKVYIGDMDDHQPLSWPEYQAGVSGMISSYVTTTWAAKPAADEVEVGTRILVTNFPAGGRSFWYSDGTYWRPEQNICISRGATGGGSVTGTTSKTAVLTVTIPGGVLQEAGGIQIRSNYSHTNSAGTKTISANLDGYEFYINTPSTTLQSTGIYGFQNKNAPTAQVSNYTPFTGGPGSTAIAPYVGAIDTEVDTTLRLYVQLASGGDTCTLSSWDIWLI